ncbi:MAG: hypothetical protein H6825_09900 [Planctomycetes bacterium]|nr:hypothetical protein [Planctomycetota bacterium]
MNDVVPALPSRRTHLACLLLLVGVAALFFGPPPRRVAVTSELLEDLRAELAPALTRQLGSDAGLDVPLFPIDAAGLVAYWPGELARLRAEPGHDAALDDLSDDDVPGSLQACLGWCDQDGGSIHVRSDLEDQAALAWVAAGLLPPTDFVTREYVGSILGHELVHAADAARLGGLARFESDPCRAAVAEALGQGHADVVSQRVCAELGWPADLLAHADTPGWEAGSAVAKQLDESRGGLMMGITLRASVMHSISWATWQHFAEALLDLGGEDLVLATLHDPPDDVRVIFHPGWVVDPASRPPRFDLDTLVRAALDVLPGHAWKGDRFLDGYAVPARLAYLLPEDERPALGDGACPARMGSFVPSSDADAPAGRPERIATIDVALFEAASEAQAAALVDVIQAWIEPVRELGASGRSKSFGAVTERVEVAGHPGWRSVCELGEEFGEGYVLCVGCLVIDVESREGVAPVREVVEAMLRAADSPDTPR